MAMQQSGQKREADGATPGPSVQPEQEGSATRQQGDRSGAGRGESKGAGNQQMGERSPDARRGETDQE